MKRFTIIVGCYLAVTASVWANGGEDFPFHVGERLSYNIFWGPIIAGRGSLEVAGIEPVDGHDCYHLVAQAKTTGLIDLLFHVDSKSESWLDVNQLFTRRYSENRVEGKKARSTATAYDYDNKQAVSTNLVNGKTSAMPLNDPVQDVISAMYYVRTQPIALLSTNTFVINAGDTNYTVNVCPDLRKTLQIRPLGDVQSLRIEPKPTLNIVAANKGRMWFWLSDDKRKLPVLVSSDMKIGSARLVLFKVESDTPATDKAGAKKLAMPLSGPRTTNTERYSSSASTR